MPYLSIIDSLFKLINVLAQKARDKDLMDAGAAGAIIRISNEGRNKIYKARLDRANTALDDDSLRDDPANRD